MGRKYFLASKIVFVIGCLLALVGSYMTGSRTAGGILVFAVLPAIGALLFLPFSKLLRPTAAKCHLSVFEFGFLISFALLFLAVVALFGGAVGVLVTPVIAMAVIALLITSPFALLAYFVGRNDRKLAKLDEQSTGGQ